MPTLSASFIGLVNGDTSASLTTQPTLATSAGSGSHVGSYAISASGAVDPDYAIGYVNGTLSVTPVPLTITADDASREFESPDPAFTASYFGLVNGDDASVLEGSLVISDATSPDARPALTQTP